MGADTEQLRRDIENTRRELTSDADALTEKVSPARIVDRRVTKTKNSFGNVREKIMGSASNSTSSGKSAVSGAASSMGDSASDLAETARSRAEGNPLAAGLIAFGVGWLASALIPASAKEQEAAGQLVDAVKEHSQPLTENLGQIANEVKDNMTESVQLSAASVQSTATDAAQRVKEHGQSAAQDVGAEARQAGQHVREQSGSGS